MGIFYVRDPRSGRGEISSMAFKYLPHVTGDGTHTLGQLVAMDERAGKLQHLYQPRNRDNWQRVLAKGERYRLVFSASHCRGAVFRDARDCVTPELTRAIHEILTDLPEFHYGRLDVKFSSLEALQQGRDIEIVEINSASSESIHIWDGDISLAEAVRSLLWQYRTLFHLGAYQLEQGRRPPGLLALLRHWRLERRLSRHYPETD